MEARKSPFCPRTAALVIAVVLTPLSGCRFGNKVEYAPPRYKVTTYETAPQTLTFCGLDSRPCQAAATNLLPDDVFTQIITDPMLLIEDSQLKQAVLVSSEDTSMGFDYSSGSILFGGETNRILAWTGECETTLTGLVEGGLNATAPHAAGAAGRAELKLTVTRKFEGASCGEELYEMYQCYLDAAKCPGASESDHAAAQSYVSWLFGAYLQSGALLPEDLPEVRSVSYEVFYQ
ncbi:MAG: hypothetical protein NDJ90_01370 [Oligoflexia bacterium]|nr:hypothetical protein [Oligoflexia bacterium]